MKKNKKVLSTIAAAAAFGVIIPTIAVTPASAAGIPVESVKINGMAAPDTVKEMAIPYTEATVEVTYADKSTKIFPLEWKQLFNTGEELANINGKLIPASTPLDVKGNPILFEGDGTNPSDYFISNAPDANTVLSPINGKHYMVSHYESHSVADGSVPDSMTLTELKQNDDGTLDVVNVRPIDFSAVNGLWIPCNGSLTPWNTHLGSEEYDPDAFKFETDKESNAYKDVTNFAKLYFGDSTKGNPYYYGWSPEVTVNADGSTNVVKHYSMGRFSKELGQVLPDNKTVLFGDDGADVALFMYVADKAGDLSAGTLYSAKYMQTSDQNGGAGDLEWIKLGHATDDEVQEIIDGGIKFSDIFQSSAEAAEGFTEIRVDGSKQYIKLKDGMETAAAFLESRRYAQYLGATAEFNKMEGVAVNAKSNVAYVTISDINKGMSDGEGHVNLPKEKAGAVYELPLKAAQKDSEGNVIPSSHVPTSFDGLLVGQTLAEPDAYGNTHDANKISAPDNIHYSEAMDKLFIGEDSSGHINNFVWSYDPASKELERILSVPAGAEATGLRAVDGINGFSYTMSNFQHPGDGVAKATITAVDKDALVKLIEDGEYGIDKTAAVGYIYGLSLADKKPNSFKDVRDDHWALKYISSLANDGIIKGKTADIFDPEGTLTRGQFISLIVRTLDLQAKNNAPFSDVSGQLASEVAAAYEAGITTGVSKGKFAPNQKITREQMAAILIRAYNVKTGTEYTSKTSANYSDSKKINKNFLALVDAAYELGLMTGDEKGTFKPKETANRAQAAKVIYNLSQK